MRTSTAYLIAFREMWRTEWRYTYCSARREWPRRVAVRKWARELRRGMLDLPRHAAEVRKFERQ